MKSRRNRWVPFDADISVVDEVKKSSRGRKVFKEIKNRPEGKRKMGSTALRDTQKTSGKEEGSHDGYNEGSHDDFHEDGSRMQEGCYQEGYYQAMYEGCYEPNVGYEPNIGYESNLGHESNIGYEAYGTSYWYVPAEMGVEPVKEIDPLSSQLSYYFTTNNLCKDIYLRQHMDSEGWIKLDFIRSFARIRRLVKDRNQLEECARSIAELEVEGSGKEAKVRVKSGWERWLLLN